MSVEDGAVWAILSRNLALKGEEGAVARKGHQVSRELLWGFFEIRKNWIMFTC